jgi:hypothetical protein
LVLLIGFPVLNVGVGRRSVLLIGVSVLNVGLGKKKHGLDILTIAWPLPFWQVKLYIFKSESTFCTLQVYQTPRLSPRAGSIKSLIQQRHTHMHPLTAAWPALGPAMSWLLLGVISMRPPPSGSLVDVALGILGNPFAATGIGPLGFMSGALAREWL